MCELQKTDLLLTKKKKMIQLFYEDEDTVEDEDIVDIKAHKIRILNK